MAQTLLAFDPHPADRHIGFELGWDHAHHGLVPPPEQLLDGNPLRQGWLAGRACFGGHTLGASRRVRQLLQLRLHAWQRGRAFDLGQVTPHYLGQIEVPVCPITRQVLVEAEASVDRVCDQAGYGAGNLAMISLAANRAKGACTWDEALTQVQRAEAAESRTVGGLDAAAWARVAVLISFVTPLPHARAACVPLRVLPPNRLRLLNPVQGLQAVVTRALGRPDGTRRLRALSALLPGEALRLDFNRFLSALLPRLIGAGQGSDACASRQALEDAWCDARVNRCWQRFALQLDEALVDTLLQQGADAAIAGTHTLLHDRATATEGWALDTRGRVALPTEADRRQHAGFGGNGRPNRARILPSRARTADGHLPA
jgi:hypothetical protein